MFVSIMRSRISSQALSFQPIGNDKGEMLAFGLHVEAESPTQALEDAREPFGKLLDAVTALTGAVPFQTQMRFEKGLFLPRLDSLFTVPDALIREGLCSESPYYRLLCAYRVRDGIAHIRGKHGKVAAAVGKQVLPKLPVISATEILHRGANLGRTDEDKEKVEPVFNLTQLD